MRSVSASKTPGLPLGEGVSVTPQFPLATDDKENKHSFNKLKNAPRKQSDPKSGFETPRRSRQTPLGRGFSLQRLGSGGLGTNHPVVSERRTLLVTAPPGPLQARLLTLLTPAQRKELREDVLEMDKCLRLTQAAEWGHLGLPGVCKASFFSVIRAKISFEFGQKAKMADILDGIAAKDSRRVVMGKIREFVVRQVVSPALRQAGLPYGPLAFSGRQQTQNQPSAFPAAFRKLSTTGRRLHGDRQRFGRRLWQLRPGPWDVAASAGSPGHRRVAGSNLISSIGQTSGISLDSPASPLFFCSPLSRSRPSRSSLTYPCATGSCPTFSWTGPVPAAVGFVA